MIYFLKNSLWSKGLNRAILGCEKREFQAWSVGKALSV